MLLKFGCRNVLQDMVYTNWLYSSTHICQQPGQKGNNLWGSIAWGPQKPTAHSSSRESAQTQKLLLSFPVLSSRNSFFSNHLCGSVVEKHIECRQLGVQLQCHPQVELWAVRASGKRPGTGTDPLHKRAQGLWHSQVTGH